ncbi:AAA family ATPase [Vibrio splendidus]|uniref:AAA family ATPase n=1 Tax=Vibrio splendidus TaxID=29497 RepID=UPI003D0A04D4
MLYKSVTNLTVGYLKMQICYIWTDKFKSLHDYSLNLSNDHEFNYCSYKNKLSKIDKTSFPKDFFGDKISSLSALIGINGAGKTTALELICRCISEHYYFKQEYILVYKIDNDIYLSTNLKMEFEVDFDFTPDSNNERLTKINPIFFSNVFDNNHIEFNKSVIDLSTNRKLSSRYRYNNRFNYKNDEWKTPEEKKGELENEICFLNSNESSHIIEKKPKKIRYEIFRQSNIYLRRFIKRRSQINTKEADYEIDKRNYLADYLRELFIKERNLTFVREGYENSISMLFLQQLLVGLTLNHEDGDRICDLILNEIRNEDIGTIEILKVILDKSEDSPIYLGTHSLKEIFDYILIRLNEFFREANLEIDNSINNSKYSLVLDFNDNNSWHHEKICNVFESIFEVNVSWHGISSGQKAYINMFSSIWNCIENKRFDRESGHAIICIDEGDLYLHPQWQVEFVEKLIQSLPTISNTKVQIILTTHSPLLVSDIPKQCITLLNSDTKNEVSNNIGTSLQSFGANLYDIYDLSFGLNGLRSGNLSTKYINDVISIIDKEVINKNEIRRLKEALVIIDDEIIAHHIKKRVDS